MSSKKLDFAIIGGGIAGLTLAIALQHRGVSVKIYEQAAAFGEIGAGVAFHSNAVEAMQICHPGIYDAFEKVCTRNMWPSKHGNWFEYFDGYHDGAAKAPAFIIRSKLGHKGVHRARYLDELVKLISPDISQFGKRLESISPAHEDAYTMHFTDGSSATASAIIGCDGIKSRVRQILYGADHPCASPTYTHKYAYRALVPMDDAVAAIGEEKAFNACMHMGPGSHVLTFPVNHGQMLNIVAFHTTKDDWPDSRKLTMPAKREDALADFAGYGHDVTSLLKLAKPDLDIWAIFHLGDNPLPYYAKGGICLVGDAAHATSPHHGAGAGFCVEDSAVLAELLADKRVTDAEAVSTAFTVYDEERRERGAWLVQSSQHIGNCYEWIGEGVGDDFAKIEEEINRRLGIISNVDVSEMCERAKERLGEKLKASSS